MITTNYGKSSTENLNQVIEPLQLVCYRALIIANKLGRDISIIEGHRDLQTQMTLFKEKKSKVTKGKHNLVPAEAIDFVPYHPKFGRITGHDLQIQQIADHYGLEVYAARYKIMAEFSIIAQCFMLASQELRQEGIEVPLRWGGDWDKDNDVFNNTFDDMGHIEYDL